MAQWQSVLRPGDWVHFDGGEHQVVALTGTSVRLCSSDAAQMVVLATHLMSAPDFGVIDAAPPPQMTPFGLLDTLPAPVLAAAREWERHIVEITTGVAPEGIARPEYHPRPAHRLNATGRRLPSWRPPVGLSGSGRCNGCGAATPSKVCGAWSISGCCGSASPPAASMSEWLRWSGRNWTRRPMSRLGHGRG